MTSTKTPLLTPRIAIAWGVLILATLISWYLGTDHGFSSGDGKTVATCVVLVVAFVKIRFISMDFMELRHAPPSLRFAFDAWIVVTCGVVVGFFLGGQ